jgi:hypothetical protein
MGHLLVTYGGSLTPTTTPLTTTILTKCLFARRENQQAPPFLTGEDW